jgi:Methyltransferase small domain
MTSDRLRSCSDVRDDVVSITFANGLVIMTERSDKADRLRILPIGRMQGAVLNYLVHHPASAQGRRVGEPFAGSGAFGFMALALGARNVEFVDINPRAAEFQLANARRNGFPETAFRCVTGDVAAFVPKQRYDLVLANPPFVPTPDGIVGTLNSNGGPDGNRFVAPLLARLDEWLAPDGEALVCLYQLVREDMPLLSLVCADALAERPFEFSMLQNAPIPFSEYCAAYACQHPMAIDAIGRWKADLVARWGGALGLAYMILHIGPHRQQMVARSAADKFGSTYLFTPDDVDSTPVDGRRH